MRNSAFHAKNDSWEEIYAKVVWAIWFLCAQKGEKLFRLVMDAYFYYFQHYDKIKYYLMTDYLIGIACNMLPDIYKTE
ncbi:MAG: capsular polysaccharide synthesis protein [Lachnospiraceae bacterium]